MKLNLSLLYDRARECFEKCILDEENEFLSEELGIPVNNIVVIEKEIKIVFSKRIFEEHIFEVCLSLFKGSTEVGRYIYIENDLKERVDDSLIFY